MSTLKTRFNRCAQVITAEHYRELREGAFAQWEAAVAESEVVEICYLAQLIWYNRGRI